MALPTNMSWEMADNLWATQINPFLALPILKGIMLADVTLKVGDNNINTLLARKQQGWLVVDKTGVATVYRSKPFNSTTLTLNSSAPVTVSLWVF